MKRSAASLISGLTRPWLIPCLAAACAAGVSSAFGQANTSPPKINISDTTITTRDSLRFAPQTYSMCLYSYQSNYEIIADTVTDSIPRHLIRITSRQNPHCATLAGYSGPVIVMKNLPLGIHRLVFSDSSDFKLAIPDSVRIRVVEQGSSGIFGPRKGRGHSRSAIGPLRYMVNGRLARREPRVPWAPFFFYK